MSHAAVNAFDKRYAGHAPPRANAWNPVLEAQFSHRSVRSYLPTPLAEGTLETLIGAAQSAASSSNLQLWSVVAVRDAERRAAFAELAGHQEHIAIAPLLLVFLADLSRAERIARGKGVEPEAIEYTDTFLAGAFDAALAAQNAKLAAESLGLGTVYIGALRNKVTEVAKLLGLPPRVSPVFGLVVGHPDPERPASIKPRLPQPVILHQEIYNADAEPDTLPANDETLRAFQAGQNLPHIDWTTQLTNRIATTRVLNGREHLRDALDQFGLARK
jgi:nitroreductase